MQDKYIIFGIATEEFGVNIEKVNEIVVMQEITQIPNTPAFIEGVINLRGTIVVVVDLAKRLGLPLKRYDKNTKIIIIEIENSRVGLIVDWTTEVIDIPKESIKSPPKLVTDRIEEDYIQAVAILGERLLILLDLTKILSAEEINSIRS